MRQMPKVIGVCSTTAKPAVFIISVNLSGAGKRRTDAGRYSYALRFPEMRPPIAGRFFRSSRFCILNHLLSLLWSRVKNLVTPSVGILKCTPSCRRHESTIFEIDVSVHVQFGPMTVLAARGESLCKTTVRKFLESTVNPSEAEKADD